MGLKGLDEYALLTLYLIYVAEERGTHILAVKKKLKGIIEPKIVEKSIVSLKNRNIVVGTGQYRGRYSNGRPSWTPFIKVPENYRGELEYLFSKRPDIYEKLKT